MHHWFRVYNTLVDDPKVQQLSSTLFKALVNLWCLASQNGGVLPAVAIVAYKLRVTQHKAGDIIARLVAAGLLDDGGAAVVPHNWSRRQFQSDCSTERVRRFRENRRNGMRSATPAPPAAETESSSAAQESAAVAQGARSLEAELRHDIAQAFAAAQARSVPDTGRVGLWLSQGYDAEIILAVITDIVARKPNLSSLNYFDAAIREAHAGRAPQRMAVGPPPQIDIEEAVRIFAATRHWSRWAGPAPGLTGCRAPPDLLARFGLMPDGRPRPSSAPPPHDPSSTTESPLP